MYLTRGELLTKSNTRGELNVHCSKTKKISSYLLPAHCNLRWASHSDDTTSHRYLVGDIKVGKIR